MLTDRFFLRNDLPDSSCFILAKQQALLDRLLVSAKVGVGWGGVEGLWDAFLESAFLTIQICWRLRWNSVWLTVWIINGINTNTFPSCKALSCKIRQMNSLTYSNCESCFWPKETHKVTAVPFHSFHTTNIHYIFFMLHMVIKLNHSTLCSEVIKPRMCKSHYIQNCIKP